MDVKTLPRQANKALVAQMMPFNDVRSSITETGCLIIGIGMLKGGTGKTTTTLFLALYISVVLGLHVCVVDTDDNSQSADKWYQMREQRNDEVPFDIVTYDAKDDDGPDLDDVIEELRESYDVILVDVGGAGKEAYWELCKTAHAVLLPLAPSGFESARIAATIKQAARGGKANSNRLKLFVLLVKCSGQNSLADEERAAIEAILATMEPVDRVDLRFVEPPFQISNSPDYVRAYRQTPKRAHLEEFGRLFRHMMKGLAA